MQIDTCGSNSDILRQIYGNLVKQEPEKDRDKLDLDLYDAYQKILSIAGDGNAVSKALFDLSKRVESGNISGLDLSSVATEIATDIAIAQQTIAENDAITDNKYMATFAMMSLVGGALTQNEMESAKILCTEEMEDSFKDTFMEALQGKEEAIKAKDLIRRAQGYILSRDKLNPEGAVSGALSLIYQLVAIKNPAAAILAKTVAETFGLNEVIDNNGINLAKVKEVFNSKHPNDDLEATIARHDGYVAKNREAIRLKGTASNKTNVTEELQDRRVLKFSTTLTKAIKEGNLEEVASLIRGNADLAKMAFEYNRDLYEKFGKGKQGGETLLARMKAIGQVLGKENFQMESKPGQEPERS